LHALGDYFIDHVKDNGYSNVLECLGSNMKDWLSNLNSLHDHVQTSYPKGFVATVFWSEDDVDAPTRKKQRDFGPLLFQAPKFVGPIGHWVAQETRTRLL
jgi:hypothetical protein